MVDIPYNRACDFIVSGVKDKIGRLGFSKHLVFVTKLQIYRLQNAKICPVDNFVRLQASRSP